MAIEIDFFTHFIQGSTHFSLQLNLWFNEKLTLKSNLKPPMKYFFDCSSFVSNQSVLLVLHYLFLSIFAFFVWSLILFIFPSSPANPKDELQGNIYRKKKWIGIFLQVIHQAWQFITSPSFTHRRFKLSFQLTFQMTFKIVKTKNENRSLLYNKSRPTLQMMRLV